MPPESFASPPLTTDNLEALAEAIAARLTERLRADAERLLDLPQLAERLRLSPRGVTGLVAKHELPEGLLIGGVRRWDWGDVRKYLAARQERRPRHRRRGQYQRGPHHDVQTVPESQVSEARG
jgi:predicted DNA-binding transcriptional regulator AlpA